MLKRLLVVGGVILGVVALPFVAFAAPDTSAASTVTAGALTLKDTLVSIATTVLPYAAAILAIVVGWRLAKRFVRG